MEKIPQQARYLVLRRIWANALMPWRDPGMLRRNQTLAQLLDRGTDEELLAKALMAMRCWAKALFCLTIFNSGGY